MDWGNVGSSPRPLRGPGKSVFSKKCSYWQIEPQAEWRLGSIGKMHAAVREQGGLQRGRFLCVEVERTDQNAASEEVRPSNWQTVQNRSKLDIRSGRSRSRRERHGITA